MPVSVFVRTVHKNIMFRHFLASKADQWGSSTAKTRIYEMLAGIPELHGIQYDQARRQWRNFCSYVVVLRSFSRCLVSATTTMISNVNDMAAATAFALFSLEDQLLDGFLLPSVQECIDPIKRHLGSSNTEHGMLANGVDFPVVAELICFVTDHIMPRYLDVWILFQDLENSIAESMSGDVLRALDDLELSFHLQRLRVALSSEMMDAWCALQFWRLFGDLESVRNQSILRAVKGTIEADLPPMWRHESGQDKEADARMVLRLFEDGIYLWFIQNLAWHGAKLFPAGELEEDSVIKTELPIDAVTDDRMLHLLREAGFTEDTCNIPSTEHLATLLYIAGAAQHRTSRFARTKRKQNPQFEHIAVLLDYLRYDAEIAQNFYPESVLAKIQQREMERAVIELLSNRRHVALIGNHSTEVLKSTIAALEVDVQLCQAIACSAREFNQQGLLSDVSSLTAEEDQNCLLIVAKKCIDYFIMSVRVKDSIQMMNADNVTVTGVAAGTDRLSFRQQVAARLLSDDTSTDLL